MPTSTYTVTILGGVSLQRTADSNKSIKRVQKRERKARDTISATHAMMSLYRDYILFDGISELETVLSRLSRGVSGHSLKRKRRQIRHLSDAFKQGAVSKRFKATNEVLGLLLKLYDNIHEMRQARALFGKPEFLGKLNTVHTAWQDQRVDSGFCGKKKGKGRRTEVDNIDCEQLQAFMERLRAYRENAIGVIYLLRYDASNLKPIKLLETALEHFNQAKKRYTRFARAYSNAATVRMLMLNKRRSTDTAKHRIDQLKMIADEYEVAISFAEDAGFKRVLDNNLASASMYLSWEYLVKSDAKNAQVKFERAMRTIDSAFDPRNAHPVLFVTKAEIGCMSLDKRLGTKLTPKEREAVKKDVIEWLRRAIALKFRGFRTYNRKSFAEDPENRFLVVCLDNMKDHERKRFFGAMQIR